MISGFSIEQNLTEIHQLLLEQGLPDSVKSDDIIVNQRSGKLTIEDLEPADCLTMMEKLHGRKFLGMKIFVTSVVSASPSKSSSPPTVAVPSIPAPPPPPTWSTLPTASLKLKLTRNLTPTIPKLSMAPVVIIEPSKDISDLADCSGTSGSDSDSDTDPRPKPSPRMKEKIDLFDKPGHVKNTKSESEKRKAIESPEKYETDLDTTKLSKSELKSLKKKQKRLKKLEHREAERNIAK